MRKDPTLPPGPLCQMGTVTSPQRRFRRATLVFGPSWRTPGSPRRHGDTGGPSALGDRSIKARNHRHPVHISGMPLNPGRPRVSRRLDTATSPLLRSKSPEGFDQPRRRQPWLVSAPNRADADGIRCTRKRDEGRRAGEIAPIRHVSGASWSDRHGTFRPLVTSLHLASIPLLRRAITRRADITTT